MFNTKYNYDENLVKSLTEQQIKLREQVKIQSLNKEISLIAGCDSSIINGEEIFSIFAVFTYPDLREVEVQFEKSKIELPYIPGFLAFREAPNLIKAYAKLQSKPDLIMVDGHGIAHPRGLGIASHLGVLLNTPTIGVAKKVLVGSFEMPERIKGSFSDLLWKEKKIGYALRTKDKVKPVFISPGNLISFDESLEITINTLRNHKLPEPTRLADLYSKKLKINSQQLDLI